MDDKIIVKTFGGFSMSYGDRTITDQDNRSKKLWIILEYLIAGHDRSIPQSTIIDLIWNEDSLTTDPENALKTSLHRVRGLLDELKIPEKNLILRKQGTFSWNNNIPCVFDFEDFIMYCNKATASGLTDDERAGYYDKAVELYKGEFLPKCATESWAFNMATRFHVIYVKMVHDYVSLLLKKKNYEKITELCGIAAALDPNDEDINYSLILGLYKSGKQNKAIERYTQIISVYYDEFGVEPPKRFAELYNEITTHEEAFEADLNAIRNDLLERHAEKRAYFCDYSVFQHFYRIQARACARNGISIFLCLVTLKPHTNRENDKDLVHDGMERMQGIIAESLRSSDVFSRYSKNQYIIMLPSACYENSLLVGERILKNFDRSRPRIDLNVSYAVRYLEPQLFNDQE